MLILSGENQLKCTKVIKSFPILCAPPSSCRVHLLFSPQASPSRPPPAPHHQLLLIHSQMQRQTGSGQGDIRDCPCCVPFPCHSTPTLFLPAIPNPDRSEHPLSFHASMTSHMLFLKTGKRCPSPCSPPLRFLQSSLASSDVISSVKPPPMPPSNECTPLLGAD